jgi:hypothetical protein
VTGTLRGREGKVINHFMTSGWCLIDEWATGGGADIDYQRNVIFIYWPSIFDADPSRFIAKPKIKHGLCIQPS